jgi:hypothetical protein
MDPKPDPEDKPSVIAVMEFTRWEDLTKKDKDDLNFLSTFLHQSKEFINAVGSTHCSWGGKRWAIGWPKSQDFKQIIGRYIKKFTPGKREKFRELNRRPLLFEGTTPYYFGTS